MKFVKQYYANQNRKLFKCHRQENTVAIKVHLQYLIQNQDVPHVYLGLLAVQQVEYVAHVGHVDHLDHVIHQLLLVIQHDCNLQLKIDFYVS